MARMVIVYIDPSEDNLIGSARHTAMRKHCVDEIREKLPVTTVRGET